MTTQRKLWNLLLPFRWLFFGMVFFAILSGVCIVFQAQWASFLIDQVVFQQTALKALSTPMIWLMLFLGLRGLAQMTYQLIANRIGSRIVNAIRLEGVQHILPLLVKRDGSLSTGAVTTLFTDKLDALKTYYAQYMAQMLLAAILPVLMLGFIFPLDWITGLVFLLTAPLIPLFMMLIGSQSKKATEYRWGYLSRLSDYFADTIQGMEVLKQFNQSRKNLDAIEEVSTRYAALTMEILKITFLSALALELLTTLSTAVIAVEISLRLLAGTLNFETAFFILLIAPEFYLPLRQLGLRFHAGMQGKTAAEELFAWLGELKDVEFEDEETISTPLPEPPFHLQLHEVSFTYPDEEREVLQKISLELPPRCLTALIGRSGSGKTTLAKILLRFLEPQSGRITIDGQPLHTIPLDDWYSQIAWLGQKSFYAEGTIRDTLRMVNPDADESALWQVLLRVSLAQKIENLPRRLDTPMAEFGQNFSGGEIQRLQLARAYLTPATFLILDEPTSQLDPDLEQLFIQELQMLRQQKTILLIAHRLQTVMLADQIILLDNGRIIENGNHSELLTQEGEYAQMIKTYHQMR